MNRRSKFIFCQKIKLHSHHVFAHHGNHEKKHVQKEETRYSKITSIYWVRQAWERIVREVHRESIENFNFNQSKSIALMCFVP